MSKLMGVKQLFEGRHFDREVIILCVRWYLRFKLSLRELVEMMAERGLSLAHTTIMRWVWRYAPGFEKRWKRFAQAVGRSWRVGTGDIHQNSRRMVLSLSCRGSGGADGWLQAERQARRRGRQGVFSEGDQRPARCSPDDHSGWLCRVSPRGA